MSKLGEVCVDDWTTGEAYGKEYHFVEVDGRKVSIQTVYVQDENREDMTLTLPMWLIINKELEDYLV